MNEQATVKSFVNAIWAPATSLRSSLVAACISEPGNHNKRPKPKPKMSVTRTALVMNHILMVDSADGLRMDSRRPSEA